MEEEETKEEPSQIFEEIEEVPKKVKGVNRILPPEEWGYPFGAYEVHVEGIDEQMSNIRKEIAQYKEEEMVKFTEMINGFVFFFFCYCHMCQQLSFRQ